MAQVRNEIRVARPADEVWKVAGDFAGIAAWLPGIEDGGTDGDVRTLRMGDAVIRERLLDRDDTARRYEYTIVESPMAFTNYHAVLSVEPDGDDGSRVVWTVELGPDDLAEVMGPFLAGGLQALAAQLEA